MLEDTLNLLPTTQDEVDTQQKIYSNVIDGTGENGEKLTVTLNDDKSVTVHNAAFWPSFNFAAAEGLRFTDSPVYLYYDFTLSMGAEMRFDVHVNEDLNIYDVGHNVLERYTDATTKGKPNAYKGAVNLTELFGNIDIMNGFCCILSGTDVSVTFRQFELSYTPYEAESTNERLNVLALDPMEDTELSGPQEPVASRLVWYIVGGVGAAVVVAGLTVGTVILVKKKAKGKKKEH